MKDCDENSLENRFQRILKKQGAPTPTDVGFLLGGGVRLLREFLLNQAKKVFPDGALSEHVLEDLVQDLMLYFEKSRLRKFRGESTLLTYLFTCVANRCKSELKKNNNRNKKYPLNSTFFESPDPPSQATGPAETFAAKSLQESVIEQLNPAARKFVASLKPKDKLLLRLYYSERVDWRQVATILRCPPDAAKRRRDRIVDRLKKNFFPAFISNVLENHKDDSIETQILYRSIVANQPHQEIARQLKVKKVSVDNKLKNFSSIFMELIAQPSYLGNPLENEMSVEIGEGR